VLDRVRAGTVRGRPVIGRVLVALFVLVGPRLAAIVGMAQIKQRFPDPRIRLAIFAIPFLFIAWNFVRFTVLIIAANELTGDRIIVVAAAIVLAARVFAHLSPERSHELAKTVPLTLVTLVLISGGIRDDTSLEKRFPAMRRR